MEKEQGPRSALDGVADQDREKKKFEKGTKEERTLSSIYYDVFSTPNGKLVLQDLRERGFDTEEYPVWDGAGEISALLLAHRTGRQQVTAYIRQHIEFHQTGGNDE
jgi:hypothetical protein